MDDYTRIARAIEHLDDRHQDQPSLGELAAVVGLSDAHFHRLFRRWAGVTPKDFLQCLTAQHARSRLATSASVLDSALDVGLSGPGRLHDLMVSLEAATPGEIKRGGEGLLIQWGTVLSPFGWASLGWTERGICHLAFHADDRLEELPEALRQDWPRAEFIRDQSEAKRRVGQIFERNESAGMPLRVLVQGTEFQVKVWKALLNIPPGKLVSYGVVGDMIGRPGAARAIGSACGANSVGYLIPCHRVIRETGIVSGYRWGNTRKRAMLARESPF